MLVRVSRRSHPIPARWRSPAVRPSARLLTAAHKQESGVQGRTGITQEAHRRTHVRPAFGGPPDRPHAPLLVRRGRQTSAGGHPEPRSGTRPSRPHPRRRRHRPAVADRPRRLAAAQTVRPSPSPWWSSPGSPACWKNWNTSPRRPRRTVTRRLPGRPGPTWVLSPADALPRAGRRPPGHTPGRALSVARHPIRPSRDPSPLAPSHYPVLLEAMSAASSRGPRCRPDVEAHGPVRPPDTAAGRPGSPGRPVRNGRLPIFCAPRGGGTGRFALCTPGRRCRGCP